MIKLIAFSALTIGLCISNATFAKDSARIVCSGIAEFGNQGDLRKIGISIDFFDRRAKNGQDREYTLSTVYQHKLFQGSIIDKGEQWGQGKINLTNSRSELFVGNFKLEAGPNDSYTMVLEGKINDDPASGKPLYPIKAKLPCVDLSI
jgi:hypothetical protein